MSPLRVALVAGEHSGDQLGFKLMRALREARSGDVAFSGVGGEAMEAEGLKSLFPISDIAVMGILPVLARLPTLLARIRQTAEAIIAARPDVLVIIDSPDFTHRVARRVRAALPKLPIVDYVSPSVWAWRPGRAKAMLAYVDCVLALLPFEPEAYRRLGGPRCVYVGHPLIERLGELRPNDGRGAPSRLRAAAHRRAARLAPVGSDPADGGFRRRARGAAPIGRAILGRPADPAAYRARGAGLGGQLAGAADHRARRRGEIRRVSRGHASLAASGTVTLELALAGVPMVGAYKVSLVEEQLKYLIKVPSILLPNLILGERAIPEKLQRDCTPAALAAALAEIVRDGPARSAQLEALSRLDQLMALPDGGAPSAHAARAVLETIEAVDGRLRAIAVHG